MSKIKAIALICASFLSFSHNTNISFAIENKKTDEILYNTESAQKESLENFFEEPADTAKNFTEELVKEPTNQDERMEPQETKEQALDEKVGLQETKEEVSDFSHQELTEQTDANTKDIDIKAAYEFLQQNGIYLAFGEVTLLLALLPFFVKSLAENKSLQKELEKLKILNDEALKTNLDSQNETVQKKTSRAQKYLAALPFVMIVVSFLMTVTMACKDIVEKWSKEGVVKDNIILTIVHTVISATNHLTGHILELIPTVGIIVCACSNPYRKISCLFN